jgi:hypothetical protein
MLRSLGVGGAAVCKNILQRGFFDVLTNFLHNPFMPLTRGGAGRFRLFVMVRFTRR